MLTWLLHAAPAAALTASAQASAGPSAPSSDAVAAIVVTAQKRAQNLEDVPATVTTLGTQILRDAGTRDLKDLALLIPGLTVTSTSNETFTTARIRGVGTVGDNYGLESSVGVVIDGVYRARNGVAFTDLGELERVEVLKGPQGTLFGKSTSAGVINVVTARPSFTAGAAAETTFGNYGQRGGSASITGPLVDGKLAGRLFITGREHDGFYTVNAGAGPRSTGDDMDQRFVSVRAQLLATPTPQLELRAIFDATHRDEHCCVGVLLDPGFVNGTVLNRNTVLNQVHPGATAAVADPYARQSYANRGDAERIDERGGSLEAIWRTVGGGTLTSLTALRHWHALIGQDSDFSAADLLYRPEDGRNAVRFTDFSQELRYTGQAGRLNYLVGAYYAFEKLRRDDSTLYGSDLYAYFVGRVLGGAPALAGLTPGTILQPGSGVSDRFEQDDDTYALFTHDTWALTRRWDVTLGVRYTVDLKGLDERFTTTGGACSAAQAAFGALARLTNSAAASSVVGGLCLTYLNPQFDAHAFTQHRTDSQLSGTLSTSYHLTPDHMVYASYAHGYKAGGFNLDRVQTLVITPSGPVYTPQPDSSFPAETADSYELGDKLQFLRRRLLVNLTAFYQSFGNFQLNAYSGASFTVRALPRVIARGADLDVIYQPTIRGLSFQGGLTFTETEYADTRPEDADFALPPPGSTVGGPLYRLPGSRLSFAPRYSATFAAAYERAVFAGWTARQSLQLKYTSGYNTGSDLAPQKYQKGFTLVNARLALTPPGDRYAVELWADNLFDQDYKQVAFNATLQGGETDPPPARTYGAFLGAPRTWGATLRARW